MAGWGEFFAAFVAFFLSHSLPARPGVRTRLVALLGRGGYPALYSALALAVLVWLIGAAGRAPVVPVWFSAPWLSWAPLVAMAPAVLLFTHAIGAPNPLSFGGARNERFDPQDPGLAGWVRHPLLWALLLWASGHLVANGDLAHVILFGLFAAFSALGMRLIDRRKRRLMGDAAWARLADSRRRLRVSRGGVARTLAALVLYGALLLLHAPVIGASPLG